MDALYTQLIERIDYNLKYYEHFRGRFDYLAFQYLAAAEQYAGKLAELRKWFSVDRSIAKDL